VRTKHEQALRDAIHQLLADGYDWGRLCGLCLEAMGVLEVIDPERKLKVAETELNIAVEDIHVHSSRALLDALEQAPGRREPVTFEVKGPESEGNSSKFPSDIPPEGDDAG
jgi:hypothetical protein